MRAFALLVRASLVTMTIASATASAQNRPVRLIRSTSGTKGSVQGSRFIIEDPRTTFNAGVDRQVVVLFEWEGSPGSHECKATWKDPSGTTVLISPYPYKAMSPRFSIYWTLALPESPRLGLWAVESEVDGSPAGIHTFQVQPAGAGKGAEEPARRVLSAAELYSRAQAATLGVESLDARGARLAAGSGFLLGERLVLTAFQIIEGASRVRVTPATGVPVETDEVAAWNRRRDWAALRTPPFAAVQLGIDRSPSWRVGDRCSLLESTPEGARVMAETAIVGAQDFPQAGPRISISTPINSGTIGGALLNEYGEAIAVLGGTLTPGLSLAGARIAGPHVPVALFVSTMAVPLSALPPVSNDAATRLQELAARGLFVPPLVGPLNVLTGTIARSVEKRNNIPMPVGEKTEFRRSEGDAVAFLTFDPQEKREGSGVFRIFDIDNHAVMQGRPVKLTLRPRVYSVTTWAFPLSRLEPGTYRIDLEIDAAPVWRTYFKVVD